MKKTSDQLAGLRREYDASFLLEENISPSPFTQFEKWIREALRKDAVDPNAATLSTATKNGKPTGRIVLLKGFDKKGFVFFTNYQSRKGTELAENPSAALSFFWAGSQRQVRIEGNVKKVSIRASEEYFKTRPRESQIGAWASSQSQPLRSREELDELYASLEKKFAGKSIPRPPYWGGYLLIPGYFEFWQGRASRLHDRICYKKEKTGKWSSFRLFP